MTGWMTNGFRGSFISSQRPLIYVTDGQTDDRMKDGFRGSFISSQHPLIYVTDGQTDDGMDDGRIQGKLHFIPTSFNICNTLWAYFASYCRLHAHNMHNRIQNLCLGIIHDGLGRNAKCRQRKKVRTHC
jgi:hypothetical protein